MPLGTRAVQLPDTAFQFVFLDGLWANRSKNTAWSASASSEAPNLRPELAPAQTPKKSKRKFDLTDNGSGRGPFCAPQYADSEVRIRELYKLAVSRNPSIRELGQSALGYLWENSTINEEPWEELDLGLELTSKEFCLTTKLRHLSFPTDLRGFGLLGRAVFLFCQPVVSRNRPAIRRAFPGWIELGVRALPIIFAPGAPSYDLPSAAGNHYRMGKPNKLEFCIPASFATLLMAHLNPLWTKAETNVTEIFV